MDHPIGLLMNISLLNKTFKNKKNLKLNILLAIEDIENEGLIKTKCL